MNDVSPGGTKTAPAQGSKTDLERNQYKCTSIASTLFDRQLVRGGRLHPAKGEITIASWNVEGLTEEKLITIERYMYLYDIGILCIQETHRPHSDYWLTDAGSLVVISGASDSGVEHAGVGIIVAPLLRSSVLGFVQPSNRFMGIKLRCAGGKLSIISAYAPHSGRKYDERLAFFQNLGWFYKSMSTHGPTIVYGDLNSRLYQISAGEERYIGPHALLNPVQRITPQMNRYLLLEFCAAEDMQIANTFFEHDLEDTVTYYDVGTAASAVASPEGFAQLDVALVTRLWKDHVLDVRSQRKAPISSHHFLTMMRFSVEIPKTSKKTRSPELEYSALQDKDTAWKFANRFHSLCQSDDHHTNETVPHVQHECDKMLRAFHLAASEVVPSRLVKRKRPWISDDTLALIESKLHARQNGRFDAVARLSKQVKTQVKRDREKWLCDLAGSGDWKQIRLLRNGSAKAQGRLQNEHGIPVSSEYRAETLAKYLETVQWRVRPATLSDDRPALRPTIDVETTPFTKDELANVLKKLKNNRASGPDEVPPEYWKALLQHDDALAEILHFCNCCWTSKSVPSSWHMARVRAIFKKGDPAQCGNYRPISLLNLGYKVFAALLLQRLKSGGVDKHLWPTQFGFKSKYGTADALFIVRRLLDRTLACKDESNILLALDWSKAFDSISPEGLLGALQRFGLPDSFVKMVGAIYSSRTFYVSECGSVSDPRQQHFGISQGCPLSPYLFVILMSVLLTDAQTMLQETCGITLPVDKVNELLYADDTLLVGPRGQQIEKYLSCIVDCGRKYGLEMNWKKVELMRIKTTDNVASPDGQNLAPKSSFIYLGTSIAANGNVDSELARRLGMARADFDKIHQVWSHTRLTKWKKYQIYTTCVVSRLLYGLQITWLGKAARQRLDGFHARCVRKILGVQPAYWSRVSNETVFKQMGAERLSSLLLEQQLGYLGKLARRPDDCPVKQFVFGPDLERKTFNGQRRRGRPKLEWVNELFKIADKMFSSSQSFNACVLNETAWRSEVRNYCRVYNK